jgi:hypothetical protein
LSRRSAKPNLLDAARQELAGEVVVAACRVAEVEGRIAELRAQTTEAGYELVAAKDDLRTSIAALTGHDARRRR